MFLGAAAQGGKRDTLPSGRYLMRLTTPAASAVRPFVKK